MLMGSGYLCMVHRICPFSPNKLKHFPTLAAMTMEDPPLIPRMGIWVWAEMKSRIWAMASWSVSSPKTTPCREFLIICVQIWLMILLGSVSFIVTTSTLGGYGMWRKSSFSSPAPRATSLELPTRMTAILSELISLGLIGGSGGDPGEYWGGMTTPLCVLPPLWPPCPPGAPPGPVPGPPPLRDSQTGRSRMERRTREKDKERKGSVSRGWGWGSWDGLPGVGVGWWGEQQGETKRLSSRWEGEGWRLTSIVEKCKCRPWSEGEKNRNRQKW